MKEGEQGEGEEEDADVIEKIYDIVKENPEKTREEICEILMNQKI